MANEKQVKLIKKGVEDWNVWRRENPDIRPDLSGANLRCWLDEHQLLPGDKVYTEVDRGIRLWDKVLLCCSKDALTSWWVDHEIQIAFEKEQQLWRERKREVLALIPLNLDEYLFIGKWKSGLATQVKARMNWTPFLGSFVTKTLPLQR